MNRKIIGVTVGTPISPAVIEEELKPVKTVNGVAPDENGNVVVTGGGTVDMSAYATKDFVANEISKIEVSSQIAGKVDKSSVVNNFTATEPGFVADARTVAILNDKLTTKIDCSNHGITIAYNSKMVTICGLLTKLSTEGNRWADIGVLPEDCPRASYNVKGSASTYKPNGYAYINIQNGIIQGYFPNQMTSDTSQTYFNISYLAE